MPLRLKKTHKYGRLRYYPVDRYGKMVAQLMKKKTFSEEDLELIKLIFEVQMVGEIKLRENLAEATQTITRSLQVERRDR